MVALALKGLLVALKATSNLILFIAKEWLQHVKLSLCNILMEGNFTFEVIQLMKGYSTDYITNVCMHELFTCRSEVISIVLTSLDRNVIQRFNGILTIFLKLEYKYKCLTYFLSLTG